MTRDERLFRNVVIALAVVEAIVIAVAVAMKFQ